MRQFGQIQYGCFSVPAISTVPWHAGHVGVSNLESISSMKCPSLSPRERSAARPSVEEPGRAPGPGAVLSPHRLKRCERTSCSSEQCPLLRPSAYACELREGVPQVGDWRSPVAGARSPMSRRAPCRRSSMFTWVVIGRPTRNLRRSTRKSRSMGTGIPHRSVCSSPGPRHGRASSTSRPGTGMSVTAAEFACPL